MSPDSQTNVDRDELLWSVLHDLIRRRNEGEVISDEEILEQHAELQPELEHFLKRASKIEAARGMTFDSEGVSDQYLNGLLPRRFGNYELEALIAHGGMGTVYLARQFGTDRPAAIKMIREQELANPEALVRFFKESSTAGQLSHPNIVTVFEAGEEDGKYFYSMEYIDGETVAELTSQAPLKGDAAVEILIPVAKAVAFAHKRGLIHRDLKPSNIMIDAAGIPRVTDFGLAKQMNDDSGTTKTGQVIGSASYISPEQVVGNNDRIDQRSDVYGLGAILYEMLTRRPPFSAESTTETLMQALHEEPVPPTTLIRTVSRDLETICLKCLEKRPERRYQTALQLVDDLERWAAGKPIQARPVSAFGKFVRWTQRERATATASGFVAVLAASLIAALTWGNIKTKAALEQSNRDFLRAERSLYLSQINLAQRAWGNGNINYVMKVLDRYAQPVHGNDFRGFEWHYLWKQTHQENDRIDAGIETTWSTLECSPDGQSFVAADKAGLVRIFDARQRKTKYEVEAHGQAIRAAAYSADGDQFATCGYDGSIQIRAARDGQLLESLAGHAGATSLAPGRSIEPHVNDLAFFEDGNRLASVGRDGTLRVWDLDSGEQLALRKGHTDRVNFVALAENIGRVFTASRDKTVFVWDIDGFEHVGTLEAHGHPVTAVCYVPKYEQVISADSSGEVIVWDARTLRLLRRSDLHDGDVNDFGVSQDGTHVATASTDGAVAILKAPNWDVELVRRGHRQQVTGVDFLNDNQVISAAEDGTIRIWSINQQIDDELPGHGDTVWDIALSPDGQLLATTGTDGIARVWDVKTLKLVSECEPQNEEVNSVSFSPNGQSIVTSCDDFIIRIFDVATGACTHEFKGHMDYGGGGEFLDENRLLSTARDGTARIWDIRTGKQLKVIQVQDPGILSCRVSPDRKLMATYGHDQTSRIWDATTYELIHEVKGHDNQVLSLRFSRDGTRFATAGRDGKAIVWDTQTCTPIVTMETDLMKARCARFSPDGAILVTGGGDAHVKLWDIETGDLRAIYKSHDNPIYSVGFTRDGKTLFSAGGGVNSKIVLRRIP